MQSKFTVHLTPTIGNWCSNQCQLLTALPNNSSTWPFEPLSAALVQTLQALYPADFYEVPKNDRRWLILAAVAMVYCQSLWHLPSTKQRLHTRYNFHSYCSSSLTWQHCHAFSFVCSASKRTTVPLQMQEENLHSLAAWFTGQTVQFICCLKCVFPFILPLMLLVSATLS